MFSQKSSTLMPLREQPSIHFLEHSQFNNSMVPNSDDTFAFSQPMQCSNVYQESNDLHYDNSQSQNMNLKKYVTKPLLFSSRIPMQSTFVTKPRTTNSSIGHFYDLQQKKSYVNDKEMLSTFLKALNEYSDDIKSSLEGMKSNISSEFQTNVDAMMSSFQSTGDILKKFQDDVTSKLESNGEKDCDNWKEAVLEKDTKIAVKDETIHQMKVQIKQLSSSCELANEKEQSFFEVQKKKIKELLSNSSASAESINQLCNKEVEHNTMLEQLLLQNRTLSQNIASILSWQKATNQILSTVNSSVASISSNINELNCGKPITNSVQQVALHKPVNLPISNLVNGSFKSPLPKFTRWFDVKGKPSPAAIVQPIVRAEVKPSCKQVMQKKVQPVRKALPTFDMSSDSDSGHEISEIIDKVVNDVPLRRKKMTVKKTMLDIKETPNTKINSTQLHSTPIQRSIRRYARIRKKPFSPSPMKIINLSGLPHNVKLADPNPIKHVKKKFITLEEHFSKVEASLHDISSMRRIGKAV